MSHPAKYLVIRGGEREFCTSRWGALTVLSDIFWGPDNAVSIFTPGDLSWEDEDLINDSREGQCSVLIDLDEKVLIFDLGEDEFPWSHAQLKLLLELMRTTWATWDIRYFSSAEPSILEYLGIGHDGAELRYSISKSDFAAALRCRHERMDGGPAKHWLTICDSASDLTRDFVLRVTSEYLKIGPHLTQSMSREKVDPIPREDHVREGAIINIKSRSLKIWGHIGYRVPESLADQWAGWSIQHVEHGNWAWHLHQTNRTADHLQVDSAKLVKWIAAKLVGAFAALTPNEYREYSAKTGWQMNRKEVVKAFESHQRKLRRDSEAIQRLRRFIEIIDQVNIFGREELRDRIYQHSVSMASAPQKDELRAICGDVVDSQRRPGAMLARFWVNFGCWLLAFLAHSYLRLAQTSDACHAPNRAGSKFDDESTISNDDGLLDVVDRSDTHGD